MSKRLTRRMVPLADVAFADTARGWFVRRARESRAAFERRLFALQPDDAPKARKYARAMARGVEFPPVYLVRIAGELSVDDGWHRVCAAALAGRDAIDAVIFEARTREEADTLSEVLFDLEWHGASPWAALGRAALPALSERA